MPASVAGQLFKADLCQTDAAMIVETHVAVGINRGKPGFCGSKSTVNADSGARAAQSLRGLTLHRHTEQRPDSTSDQTELRTAIPAFACGVCYSTRYSICRNRAGGGGACGNYRLLRIISNAANPGPHRLTLRTFQQRTGRASNHGDVQIASITRCRANLLSNIKAIPHNR